MHKYKKKYIYVFNLILKIKKNFKTNKKTLKI